MPYNLVNDFFLFFEELLLSILFLTDFMSEYRLSTYIFKIQIDVQEDIKEHICRCYFTHNHSVSRKENVKSKVDSHNQKSDSKHWPKNAFIFGFSIVTERH